MKIKVFTFMLLVSSFISFAQTEEFACAFNDNEETYLNQAQTGVFSNSTDPAVLYAMDPIVMKVYFWQVNDKDGQFGCPTQQDDITEEDVLTAIANLNIYFNEFNVFFKYKGLGQFNSPEVVYKRITTGLYNNPSCETIYNETLPRGYNIIDGLCQISPFFTYAKDEGYMPDNYINIYLPSQIIGFGGVAGPSDSKILITKGSFNTMGLIHEMGHALGLDHTHKGFINITNPLDENYNNCEHVTRDVNDVDNNYNANNHGDAVHDTAAVPDFNLEHYYELLRQGYSEEYAAANDTLHKYIGSNCGYTGHGKDCQGNNYDISPSDTKNVMSYTRNDCKESISIGQAIRMHEAVEGFPSLFENRRGDLPDLFEPYKGEYYIVGPLPNNYHPPLFQPGFKYLFVECENIPPISTPQDYGIPFTYSINTILLSIDEYESDYSSITHPNHSAIQIKHAYGVFLDNPEKCYDNWNRKPSGGSVTKFNDNVFNTNVTITPQDSTSINNENLIQNLDIGLYKIEKNYYDGSTQETVILKGNN